MPIFPANPMDPFDLAHIFSGGKVVATSDDHFGSSSNLLLPGRGRLILNLRMMTMFLIAERRDRYGRRMGNQKKLLQGSSGLGHY